MKMIRMLIRLPEPLNAKSDALKQQGTTVHCVCAFAH